MNIIDPRINPADVPPLSWPVVIADQQDEYQDLPSVRTPAGQVITRWEFTPEERAAIAQGEDLYITIISRGSINPLLATVGPLDWHAMERTLK